MLLIGITLLFALTAALIAFVVSRRSSYADPTAPQIAPAAIDGAVRHHRGLRTLLDSKRDAGELTGLGLTAAMAVVIASALIVALLLVMIHTNTGFARWDHSASAFGANHASALSTHLLKALSQLGGALIIVPLAVVVGLVETYRLRSRTVFPFLVVLVGGQFLIANVIKAIVGRARPHINQLAGFSGSSFPSGHATAAAACLAGFALVMGRRRSPMVRSVLSATAVGLAVAIGLTRVWLGVHWLTDVLAGLALGWAWFALSSIAFGGRRLRFGAPVEVAQRSAAPLNELSDET